MIVAGCDIGSLTAKAVIMENGKILSEAIVRVKTRPEDSAKEIMQMALDKAKLTMDSIDYVVGTGYGREKIPFADSVESEISCHAKGAFTGAVETKKGLFEIAAIAQYIPNAAGPYIPDAFTNTKDGRGITWGISHLRQSNDWSKNHLVLTRFDCDLSLDGDDPQMKRPHNLQLELKLLFGERILLTSFTFFSLVA